MAHQATAQVLKSVGVLKNELEKTIFVERFNLRPALNTAMAWPATYAAAAAQAIEIANKDWELAAGTNSSADDVTFADGGGILFTLDGGANDQCFIVPHQDTNQSALGNVKWNTNDSIAIGTTIETGASVTAQIILAGFTSDATVDATFVLGDNDDELYFYYNPASSANWQAATSRSGTDTLTDLGSDFAVAASTKYELVIAVDSDRVPHFYINGQLAHKAAALDADTDLVPRIGIEATEAAAKTLIVRKVVLAKEFND